MDRVEFQHEENDHVAPAAAAAAVANNNEAEAEAEAEMVVVQWRLVIFEICFNAIGVAVQALQTTPNQVNGRFQFRCFRTAMVISFASLLMSVYVYRYSDSAAFAFEHIGVFFGVLAFLLAVTLDS